jgi:hypothetical protein
LNTGAGIKALTPIFSAQEKQQDDLTWSLYVEDLGEISSMLNFDN